MAKRRFGLSLTTDNRCRADITLGDGSGAQCMRLKKVGDYCQQHALLRLQDAIYTVHSMAEDGIGTDEVGYREATAKDCAEVLDDALRVPVIPMAKRYQATPD